MKILVVDDEEIKRVSLCDDLGEAGYHSFAAADGKEAMDMLGRDRFDVVITDLRMPGVDGMDILKYVRRKSVGTEVIMMTAYGNIPLAVEAMKLGAFNFITKPFNNEIVFSMLERIAGVADTTHRDSHRKKADDIKEVRNIIAGGSAAMHEVRKMVCLCARNDATVLLTGETGTGKDLAAYAIHRLSSRRSGPFVKVNCSTYPENLIESALFGHTKGSFTGADVPVTGKFEMAHSGTIYLDDVDDIPPAHQIKLLRIIDERIYERIGSPSPIKVDVRILASTKKNLLLETENGNFRSDLYYRLNVLRLNLPPLRSHLEDIDGLSRHLLAKISNGGEYRIIEEAVEMLKYHKWPGNVRELYHALERAYLTGNGFITSQSLGIEESISRSGRRDNGKFKEAVLQAERELLEKALDRSDGNKSAAARLLGMKLSTFRDKLSRHGLL